MSKNAASSLRKKNLMNEKYAKYYCVFGIHFCASPIDKTLGDVPSIGVESSRVDISRQLQHLPPQFNPALMAAQLGMFSNTQLLTMMQAAAARNHLLQNHGNAYIIETFRGFLTAGSVIKKQNSWFGSWKRLRIYASLWHLPTATLRATHQLLLVFNSIRLGISGIMACKVTTA
ncbi:hypothetical protein DICVIV_04166 [Dictyocaulus viviparus]|uniref:Uncharacterized protein n=1 Tax=Dictyocaulus viviparus TaxID=29172 RepID=A0A0D8Y0X7_DICVI|nr:hypothetical protein DICVIV_04166 [Dictyocaulus viviparus]